MFSSKTLFLTFHKSENPTKNSENDVPISDPLLQAKLDLIWARMTKDFPLPLENELENA